MYRMMTPPLDLSRVGVSSFRLKILYLNDFRLLRPRRRIPWALSAWHHLRKTTDMAVKLTTRDTVVSSTIGKWPS